MRVHLEEAQERLWPIIVGAGVIICVISISIGFFILLSLNRTETFVVMLRDDGRLILAVATTVIVALLSIVNVKWLIGLRQNAEEFDDEYRIVFKGIDAAREKLAESQRYLADVERAREKVMHAQLYFNKNALDELEKLKDLVEKRERSLMRSIDTRRDDAEHKRG